MTRMAGPDCAVIFNLINTHAHAHTHRDTQRKYISGISSTKLRAVSGVVYKESVY